jgi:Ca2+-binding RTX toxin-like protein
MFERIAARRVLQAAPQADAAALHLEGSGRDETLRGGDGSDTLYGRGGDDVLLGGGGDDLLVGGPGSDRLSGGAGRNTVAGGAGNDSLSGGGLLDGGEGDDLLNGSGVMRGGNGDDWYTTSTGGGVIEEAPDAGLDIVQWGGGDCRLAQNVENLFALMAFGSDIVGNRLDNRITVIPQYGWVGDNLFGEAGDDTLEGGGYRLQGGAGDDALYSWDAGSVVGGAGDDILRGSGGRWWGGKGADRFVAGDGSRWGTIEDYDAREGDVIDLSAIDADSTTDGDQAFVFVRTFFGGAGEALLVYDRDSDRTRLLLDVNGDGQADFDTYIQGHARAGDGWVL